MNKPNTELKITGYGACTEVGRSAFIVEDGNFTMLLEAGIKIMPKRSPSLAPIGLKERAKDIDAIVLSHAHVDHSGYIPALFENGFKGKVYMTYPTKDIVRLLWEDQLKIDGRHWSEDAMLTAYDNIESLNYRTVTKITDKINIELYNSGHILGAAMIYIKWGDKKMLYTGDINDQLTPLFDGYDMPEEEIDILLSESTNGIREIQDRKEVEQELIADIKNTLKSGNKVIIPSFAIGRSQELLCAITKEIKEHQIYVDGMINKMIAITEKYLDKNWIDSPLLDRMEEEGIESPFQYKNVVAITPTNIDNTHSFRKHLGRLDEPFIIVTTSGMMEPSPLHTHLRFAGAAKNNLIAVTGYQAEGTTGREVIEGKKTIKISIAREKFIDISLNAKIKKFGFSGHTSAEGINRIIKKLKPKSILLIHGDHSNQLLISDKLANGVIPQALEYNTPVVV